MSEASPRRNDSGGSDPTSPWDSTSKSDPSKSSDRSLSARSSNSETLASNGSLGRTKRYHSSKRSLTSDNKTIEARTALIRHSTTRLKSAVPFLVQLDAVPLVGRSAELETLKQILNRTSTTAKHATVESSNPSTDPPTEVLWVSGQPGSGKSSLVAQLQTGGMATVTKDHRLPLQPLFGKGKFDADMGRQHGAALPFIGFVAAMDELVQAIQKLSKSHPQAYQHIHQQLLKEFPRESERTQLRTVISKLDNLLLDQEEQNCSVEEEPPAIPLIISNKTHAEPPSELGFNRSDYMDYADQSVTVETITEEGGEGQDVVRQTVYPLTSRWAHLRNLPNKGEVSEADSFSQCFSPSPGEEATVLATVDASRSKNVLYFLLRRFLKVVSLCALHGHPIVLTLDDMQWADQDSLDLFLHLATDRQSSGLILVGCYRDNEEDSNEALQTCMQAVKKSKVHTVTDISLENLSVADIQAFLAELLSCDAQRVRDLADVIHSKTSGNPFYFRQFVLSLNDEELLLFDTASFSWKFDVEQIRSEMAIADNLAQLVTQKIRNKIPVEAQFILQMASCLGSSFDESTITFLLHEISAYTCTNSEQWTPTGFDEVFDSLFGEDAVAIRRGERYLPSLNHVGVTVSRYLDLCVSKGILETLTTAGSSDSSQSSEYRFAHDHIQLAARSLMENEERGRLQLLMGELLQDEINAGDVAEDTTLFVAADLMNRGVSYIPATDVDKKLSLVRLNLRAGKKATNAAAFSSALAYLRAGIFVLKQIGPPSVYWVGHKELCLELFGFASEASFCHGKLEEMQLFIDEILNQDTLSFLEKLRAHSTHVHALGTQNKLLEAIDKSLYLLQQLGTDLPKHPSPLNVLYNLIKTKRLVEKFGRESILALPRMEDENLLTQMLIMDNMATYAYAANQELLAIAILKMVRRSLKYGVCTYSPTAIGGYANLVGCVLGDYKQGNIMAKTCLDLNKNLGLRELRARSIFVSHNFSMHWNEPLPQSFRPYLRGYNYGLETGDLENAMFCITYHCDVAMHTGRRLSSVAADFAAYTQQMKELELEYNYTVSLVPWQLALNLMGDCEDPLVLTGKAMDQEHMLAAGEQIPFLRSITNAARLCLACLFNDYELSWKMVDATKDLAQTNLGQHVVWRSALFEGLAAFGQYRETGKGVWKKRAGKVMKRLKTWVTEGNMNCVHILQLLEAEKMATEDRNHEKIRRAYDKAISSASRIGFSNDQALANEKAGTYFLEDVHGETGTYWAQHYFESAYRLYHSWEAFGKSKDLQRKYPHILSNFEV